MFLTASASAQPQPTAPSPPALRAPPPSSWCSIALILGCRVLREGGVMGDSRSTTYVIEKTQHSVHKYHVPPYGALAAWL